MFLFKLRCNGTAYPLSRILDQR